MRRWYAGVAAIAIGAACASRSGQANPQPAEGAPRTAVETVKVRDAELEQRVARLELRLLERAAELEELRARLDEARREVVRTMAKLQTVASRAEAASGMAEAEIALRSLLGDADPGSAPEAAQAMRLLAMSNAEFQRENYGGALYLANQAKSIAVAGQGRLPGGERGKLRPGEVVFALPLRLQASTRANVREGPGSGFRVAFTVEAGTSLVAYSHVEQWVRVRDGNGRSGWIFYNLVGQRQETR